jgi:hypothetical protein
MADPARASTVWEGHGGIKACWLCGIRLPVAQLVADGGDACPDVRWYCRDARACTQRWTTRPPPPPPGAEPPASPAPDAGPLAAAESPAGAEPAAGAGSPTG